MEVSHRYRRPDAPPPASSVPSRLAARALRGSDTAQRYRGVSQPQLNWLTEATPDCASAKEVSPVAAVVGAMVANEAMKVVTGKDAPLNNFMCFDALGGSGGRVYKL